MASDDRSGPDHLLPLPPVVFHILVSLGDGERHGYALRREITERTSGKVKLGSGVLYGSIAKMIEQGLIEESGDRPVPHLDDSRRRYYRLTAFGRRVAAAETARLRDLAALAASRFGVPSRA